MCTRDFLPVPSGDPDEIDSIVNELKISSKIGYEIAVLVDTVIPQKILSSEVDRMK